jgi:long-chain acyl-CoA synthetase
MSADFIIESLNRDPDVSALVWGRSSTSAAELLDLIDRSMPFLDEHAVAAGSVIGLMGDFTPASIAMLFALIERRAIVAPFTANAKERHGALKFEIAQLEGMIEVDATTDVPSYQATGRTADHDFYTELRHRGVPGLILFTSGTSGQPKAAVHDFSGLLKKFEASRRAALRTFNFLLWDHWGGLNTLFQVLASGGTVLASRDRSPDNVCALIERHGVELLPASPTFLNLLLLSDAYKRHDLSSLRVITYGTEPMPQSTLDRLQSVFPGVKLKQTYGLIELGVLQSQSKGNDSLWMKMGGAGFETRVVDGILQIRAQSAMLGYLNASSPFTEDGYFITGDMVETDGEYFRVLGRRSELINVGGEKVYPQEIEEAMMRLENVADVVVFGEKNPLTGNIVCARVVQQEPEPRAPYIARLKKQLKGTLQSYQVPVKIMVEEDPAVSERFKKVRAGREGGAA